MRVAASIYAALFALSCGGDSSVAPPAATPVVTTITLDKASLTFDRIGMRDTLRATVRDQAARPMSGVTVSWSSSDLSVATVDAAGVVTSVGLGNAQISASIQTKATAASVTVRAAGLELVMCTGGAPVVALLVEAQLRASVNAQLARFSQDLCADGYTVWMVESVPKTPPEIRAYLADALTRSSGRLTGAMLIGDIPHAYQYVVSRSTNPAFPDLREEAISFQYYADVNGTFAKSAGYTSARQYSFDVHTGDVNWELWIGVLPTYKGNATATVNALIRYFDKNNAYRTGGAKPPRVFVQVSEHFTPASPAEDQLYLGFLREGTYAWTPWSNSANARLYINTTTAQYSLAQAYADLRNGAGDFFVQDSHGFYGASGRLTIAEVESNPVRTIFYWSNGCAIGDLDRADNFLTSIVYSPTSSVLVAKGTTNDSGGMGNNQNGFFGRNVAVAMTSGSSLGTAMLSHVNVPLIFPWSDSREFHFGTPILIGDPTLKLRP